MIMVKKNTSGYEEIVGKRSIPGHISRVLFWGFNLLMLIWVIGGYNSATEGMENMSGAEAAGAAIGTGIGMTMLFILWVIGDIIFGLFYFFTRPTRQLVKK
jgi:uncharacterized membrane protein YhaH (DUF805 family)